jgi:HPt (histidine-containing phosphotransfer) domain-containing protein
MDGIEATKTLREMGYDQPIIALTANAVAGQADIFLGNGFNDFISKPIDVRHLNTMLNKFIRDKQPPEVIKQVRAQLKDKNFLLSDAAKEPENKKLFLEVFLRDAHRSIAVLETFVGKGKTLNKEEIQAYIIHTHGMKCALANIGKTDISAIALRLEMLGRDNNVEAMAIETPAFLELLKTFVNEITPKEETAGEEVVIGDQVLIEDKQYLTDMLLKIKIACGEYNESAVEGTLAELKKITWSKQVKELFNKMDEQLLHSDFDEIIIDINKLIEA